MSDARLVIGTRGSQLALWQAYAVRDALLAADPELDVCVRIIKTQGDVNLSTPLAAIDDKGLFTSELETALVAGEVDLCVHSMKDVPTQLASGCGIVAMLPRADVRDVLVCGPRIQATSLAQVPAGARIGTGSLRRAAQLRSRFPEIVPAQIRGNVDTRLAKACGEDYEGAILASAGITRLGLVDAISCYISTDEMLPAVGQGAVGIEARLDDETACAACSLINDHGTYSCVMAERVVLEGLDGGCKVPMGAYARITEDETLRFDAFISELDGSQMIRVSLSAAADFTAPDELAHLALNELLERGALDVRASVMGKAVAQ